MRRDVVRAAGGQPAATERDWLRSPVAFLLILPEARVPLADKARQIPDDEADVLVAQLGCSVLITVSCGGEDVDAVVVAFQLRIAD